MPCPFIEELRLRFFGSCGILISIYLEYFCNSSRRPSKCSFISGIDFFLIKLWIRFIPSCVLTPSARTPNNWYNVPNIACTLNTGYPALGCQFRCKGKDPTTSSEHSGRWCRRGRGFAHVLWKTPCVANSSTATFSERWSVYWKR